MYAYWAALGLLSLAASAQTRVDPRALSIHPFTGQRGTTFTAKLRGTNLAGASAVAPNNAPFQITIEGIEPEPLEPGITRRTPVDLVKLRVTINPDAKPGRYPIRLITRNGISNALPIHVSEHAQNIEPEGPHESRDNAVRIPSIPAVFTGKIARRGEADYYSFHVAAGQTLTFELLSGLPQTAAGGSAATIPNFDPAITVYEPAGSWFDPARLKRIAYNDEPVWVIGKPTDAHLVHTFDKAGDYLVRIESFAGQGGPDYSYALKIASGAQPPSWHDTPGIDDRSWSRRIESTRLTKLAERGGKQDKHPSIETYRATPEPTPVKLPATIEGTIAQPTEKHRTTFRIDKPADIAFEFESPNAAPPFFNPLFRLIGPAGDEVASNVFAGRGACSGAMTKSLQAKTILPLRELGEYTVEIREATADLASPDFRYRLLIRPQVPHVGRVQFEIDALNLPQGQGKSIRVNFDREEDYRGAVIVAAEGLPPGVSAVAAADYEPDRDPPQNLGKRERYTARSERVVLVITAAADAPASTQPHEIKLVARSLVDGKPGAVLAAKTFPLMVLGK
ncbi:MAG: DVUA0089 family protein [Acidobacteria bacterium]|nr:DVUA0089 family protein [Acidobacteriota bacterium]